MNEHSDRAAVSEPVRGSQPLDNLRHEAFCELLAQAAPPSLVDAWRESAVAIGHKAKSATPGLRVSASNVHAREDVLDRIAWLRLQRAGSQHDCKTLSAARLADLMQECTNALIRASQAAQRAGVSAAQAAKIRQKIVIHAGRSKRVSDRAPAPETKVAATKMPDIHWCECGA